MGFKQIEAEESLDLGVPMSMMDVISIKPLSQWRESCLTYSIEQSALEVHVGSSSARKTDPSCQYKRSCVHAVSLGGQAKKIPCPYYE